MLKKKLMEKWVTNNQAKNDGRVLIVFSRNCKSAVFINKCKLKEILNSDRYKVTIHVFFALLI